MRRGCVEPSWPIVRRLARWAEDTVEVLFDDGERVVVSEMEIHDRRGQYNSRYRVIDMLARGHRALREAEIGTQPWRELYYAEREKARVNIPE